MKCIQIYYFSGTGNTAYAIYKLARELEVLGNHVRVNSCEEEENMSEDFDMLGIAFPIHSSYTPKIFKEFLVRLPKVKNVPLFGIVTSGYMAGDVLSYEGRELYKKGYRPFLYRNIIIGNNLHLPMLSPLKVTQREVLEKRLPKIDTCIKEIAEKVDSQKQDLRGNKIFGRVFGIL